MEQLKTIGRELAMGSQGGLYQSKDFLDLVKSIGEARSKAEEDRIVLREIDTLKRNISSPDVPKRKMKEFIIRLIYIEMLGHDASFGHIYAVKMTHDESVPLKRTGYLAVTLFLDEDHELIMLIVNTIQKDLKSDNYLVVCAALNAVCRLINEETIPAVLPQVVELLGHAKEAVRKKAIMALHRFHLRSPGSVNHLIANFRKRLCDNDPGVMGATLCPLFDLVKTDASSYKDLVVSFVSILKQIAERRLPKSYDYHQMPAPFIQIKLLKILAILGAGDKQSSEHMYTVVGDIMKKCDSSSNIGNAILYESMCCVSSIHPNTKLLSSAAEAVSKFLKSDNHNLRYMGIDALSRLIKISPETAEQHQLAVIDCLEDPDDTLKRKTFELLYKMTKSSNVEVIVDRMIDYIVNINDNHYKTEIASRCVELAEQFAPSNQWFIQTMNRVFEHAGDLLDAKLAHNLMRVIAEGFKEEDDSADSQLRSSAVESYLRIIGAPKLPSAFLQVICWVLGEYGTAGGIYSASYVTGKLCDVAEAHSADETVKAYALTALMKIYAFEKAAGRKVDILSECQSLIEELSASHSTDLQQRAYELQALVDLDTSAVETIMPLDSSCEDIEIDKNLPFLNNFVQESIEKGAQPYIPESERVGVLDISSFSNQVHPETLSHSLRFEAYERPKPVAPSMTPSVSLLSSNELVPVTEPSYPKEFHQTSLVPTVSDASSSDLKLRLDGVQKKWGRPSYSPSPSSASSSSSQQPVNGITHSDVAANTNSAIRRNNSYETKNSNVEIISEEKQKLAASLFGGPTKPERRQAPTSHRVPKSTGGKFLETSRDKTPVSHQPPPDLLDMGDMGDMSSIVSTSPSVDPFKQLEGLLDLTQDAPPVSQVPSDSSKLPDITSLYEDMTISGNSDDLGMVLGLSSANASTVVPPTQMTKGPNLKDALEKDALVRQMGVNPSNRNPNLFSDLLG